jgi:hypothetical protein
MTVDFLGRSGSLGSWGCNVNEPSGDGETTMHWACRQGHVGLLRQHGAKERDVFARTARNEHSV